MVGFTKLLLGASEDDDAAVRYVARLAAAAGADLTFADVVEPVPRLARRLLPRSWNLPTVVRAQKQGELERRAAVARRLGARPRTVLLTGSPIRALVREVVRGGHDLLAVGATSSGTVRCAGASATRLLRECPCPVLLVHPTRRRRRARVLVAVDAGPFVEPRADALTASLVESARWFAERLEGELHVLHVWVPYGERYMRLGGLTDAEIDRVVLNVREAAGRELDRVVAPFREHVAPGGVHLVKGDPRVAIADFAAGYGFDLLVVGTVARSGVAGRLIGNTAEAVLTHLPCSMLVVNPGRPSARP